MSSTGYHEPIEELSDAVRDMHRAWQQKQPDLFVMDVRNRRRLHDWTPLLDNLDARSRDFR